MLPLTHIIKDMFTNRTRLILTILAVAWGTFSIATMLAVGEGLRLTLSGVVTSSGNEALIVMGGMSTKSFKGQPGKIAVTFDEEDLQRLQLALADKAQITGTTSWSTSIFHNKNAWFGPPVTVVKEPYGQIHALSLTPGSRFINKEDLKQHRQVIVLGEKTVQKLYKPHENPVGKYVIVANKPFLVVGVQGKSLRLFMSNGLPDEYTNWVPYSTYQDFTQKRNLERFIVAPFNLNDIPRLQEEIRRLIANPRQLNPHDPGILTFTDMQEQKNKVNLFLYGLEALLGVIGFLTLIVAGVGIANVMLISVTRATREIGIRMAIGATTYEILAYYGCEALLTTAIGGALGLLLTAGLVLVFKQIPMNAKLLQYFGSPRPVLSFNVLLIVIGALGVIGLLAGLFPARKAASINPAEALRHE